MTIVEINKLLDSNFSTIELFEKYSTWEKDIKGRRLNSAFIRQFSHKIDWDYFSRKYRLPESLIREHKDKVNWNYISTYSIISDKLIRDFQNKVDWDSISIHQKLSDEIIVEFNDKVNWNYISSHQKLSEEIIVKFKDKVNWNYISKYQILSNNFIEAFLNEGLINNISTVVINQILSEDIIEKIIDKVSFRTILIYQNVSIQFLEKHKTEIDWKELSSVKVEKELKDEEKIINFLDKYSDYLIWKRISDYWTLSINIAKKFIDKLDWDIISNRYPKEDFIKEFQNKIDWFYVSQNNDLTEEFIEEFSDKVIWRLIGNHTEYSLEFIRKHKDKLKSAIISISDISLIRELKDSISFDKINYFDFDENLLYEFREKLNWESIIKFRRLTEDLIIKVADLFEIWEWRWLSDIQPLSENFIRKYSDKVHWGGICFHQKLTEEFIIEHENTIGVWWVYILKYQKLSADFARKISAESWSKRKHLMLPYQDNDFTREVIGNLSFEQKESLLCDTWLYKSIEFRKEQILNLNTFKCFDDYFICTLVVDSNGYQPYYYHTQFVKGNSYEIFATQTEEEFSDGFHRSKGFYVGNFEDLCNYFYIDPNSFFMTSDFLTKEFKPLNIKVYYEDVARIIDLKMITNRIGFVVRCKKVFVIE